MLLLKMLLQFWGELGRRKPSRAAFNRSVAEALPGKRSVAVPQGLPHATQGCEHHPQPAGELEGC